MDPLTHGFVAAIAAFLLGRPELIPFAAAGAMLPDVDGFAARAFDRRPERYLFTHGGIVHSLAGAIVVAAIAWAGTALAASAELLPPIVATASAPAALAAALGGALSHLALDCLACPGLPLLAPRSDRKYTAGILPGPSIVLFAFTTAALAAIALGAVEAPIVIAPYTAAVAAFLGVRTATFAVVHAALRGSGRAVPTVNPLRWLVIRETPEAWTVGTYLVGRGTTGTATYPKYRGTSPAAVAPCLDLPEVRRVRYHSYITTATDEGGALVVADPLRQSGTIRYPPYYTEARVPHGGCRGGR